MNLEQTLKHDFVKYRKIFNYFFIIVLFLIVLILAYLCVASLTDGYPFKNRKLLKYTTILPNTLIGTNDSRLIQQDMHPPITSILDYPNDTSTPLYRRFYRYGIQVFDGLNSVTSIIWQDWTLFKDNKRSGLRLSVLVSIPTIILNKPNYSVKVFKETGNSNLEPGSTSTSLVVNEFVNNLTDGPNLLFNHITSINNSVYYFSDLY